MSSSHQVSMIHSAIFVTVEDVTLFSLFLSTLDSCTSAKLAFDGRKLISAITVGSAEENHCQSRKGSPKSSACALSVRCRLLFQLFIVVKTERVSSTVRFGSFSIHGLSVSPMVGLFTQQQTAWFAPISIFLASDVITQSAIKTMRIPMLSTIHLVNQSASSATDWPIRLACSSRSLINLAVQHSNHARLSSQYHLD
jgi:hypothetical protein